jgi:hypothetical protein
MTWRPGMMFRMRAVLVIRRSRSSHGHARGERIGMHMLFGY